MPPWWCAAEAFEVWRRPNGGLHDLGMDNSWQRPRKGDRVQINGFLGVFEVVQVGPNGATADLKHLGAPGPDYIEAEILAQELIYLNNPKTMTPSKNIRAQDR